MQTFCIKDYTPYKLAIIAERAGFLLASQYKHLQISKPQFRIMAVVDNAPHISSTLVAVETMMDKSRVTRAIDDLVERGLMIREKDPRDKRANLLALTAEGKELFLHLGQMAMRIQRRLVTSMTDEESRIFEKVLIRLEGALNQLEHEFEE